jgi:ADP-ribose pyrophosphatase YjhB (NUDIX family)
MVLGADARTTEVAAFVLVAREGQVLLVKQAYGLGLWALPGGLAAPGETVEAAAVREAAEETGLDVALRDIVAVADRGSLLLVVFAGSVSGGQTRPEPGEIDEVRWFSLDDLLTISDGTFALARELARAALRGWIGNGLVPGAVTGPDQAVHSVFWSMAPPGTSTTQTKPGPHAHLNHP